MKMTPYDLFVIQAILGRMREADDMMRDPQMRLAILKEAKIFRDGVKDLMNLPPTLYRGLLLSKKETQQKRVVAQEATTFVSWSEDVNVALWFADETSTMSAYVLMNRPGLTGWIAELHDPDYDHILFHHSWITNELVAKARFIVPRLGSEARQFEWNIATQKEVVMLPHAGSVEIARRKDYDPPSTEELDKKFLWPWLE